jgi:glycosyltransferase involved in cell wall biosynthesis
VCTRNRGPQLAEALPHFASLRSRVPWELLIVDNGSTDSTREILLDFESATSIQVRLLHEPTPGLSRARNTGWRSAAADIVAFTDDDCYPAPDYLDQIWDVFQTQSIGFLGGRILLHDPTDFPITIQLRNDSIALEPRTLIPHGLIHGANMAMRKQLLNALGGFDEMLGAGTPFPSEDLDFTSKALAAGFRGVYHPGPMVYHHHRRRTRAQAQSLDRTYQIGRGAYYMKCLLDPSRRLLVAKSGYWTLRWNIRKFLRMTYGACYYLLRRISVGRS